METKYGVKLIDDIKYLEKNLEEIVLKEELKAEGISYRPGMDIHMVPERLECYREGLNKLKLLLEDPAAFWSKVRTIDDKTFSWAETFIRELVIPEGYDTIESCAFTGFKNLEKVELPSTISYIYSSAFDGCKKLEEINLDEIVHIGNRAFKGCSRLKKVALPKLESIEPYAFQGCRSIEEIAFPKSKSKDMDKIFASCVPSNVVLTESVPSGEKQGQPGEEE